MRQPARSEKREKPQRWAGTIEDSSRRAYGRERGGTKEGSRQKKRAWSAALKKTLPQWPATVRSRMPARRASASRPASPTRAWMALARSLSERVIIGPSVARSPASGSRLPIWRR